MAHLFRLPALSLLLLVLSGSAQSQDNATLAIAAQVIADQLDQPLFLAAPPADPRLFVVEQPGRIRVIVDGVLQPQPFLDIRELVSTGGEQGLLGLAFHPDFAANGRFFVNYTDREGDTQIVAYQASADGGAAEASLASAILTIDQPFANHNGGWIGFGPDGYLYIAMGDGGSGGDPLGSGQDLSSLLGKVLRIDVDGAAPYAIPPTNPFATGGGAAEIFALGLRNPWRNAFDGQELYVADVGQGQLEEVTVISIDDAGANLGWNVMEGSACFAAAGCDQANLVLPAYEYAHDEGCSITGGYVYRGGAIPELDGQYFFADYCSGFVRSFRYENGQAQDLVDWSEQLGDLGPITSFGIDGAGELYIMTAEGSLLKIVRSE